MNNELLKSSLVQAAVYLGIGVGSAFLGAALGIPFWAYLCLAVVVGAAWIFLCTQAEQKEQEAVAEYVVTQAKELSEAREELRRLRSGD